MSVRDVLVRLLDRNGGRTLLTWITNAYAGRLNGGPTMSVSYDEAVGSWVRKALGETLYDGPAYTYYANHLTIVGGQTPWSTAARHNWFGHYAPQPGDVILDIGAEIGSDVPAFALGVGVTGTVLAVEAHPSTFKLLEATVRGNAYPQVRCIAAAISDRAGEIFIEDADSMLSSAVSAKRAGHRVPALSLDDLCGQFGIQEVALLKMNIEGSERDALRGMHETLKRTRTVCVACHDFRADRGDGEFFRTRSEVLRALIAAGFTVADAKTNVPSYERDHVHAWWPMPQTQAASSDVRDSRRSDLVRPAAA